MHLNMSGLTLIELFLSSKIVVNELINKSIESKRKGENKNNSKAKVKKSKAKGNNATNINDPTKPPPKTTTRNVSPAVDVPNTSENQDLSHSSEESYKNSQTSEESAEEFDFSEAISLPLEYPEIYSWVGVREYKKIKLSRGRCTSHPFIHVGKV